MLITFESLTVLKTRLRPDQHLWKQFTDGRENDVGTRPGSGKEFSSGEVFKRICTITSLSRFKLDAFDFDTKVALAICSVVIHGSVY